MPENDLPARLALFGVVLCVILVFPDLGFAADAAGGGLPWDSPLKKLVDSLTGDVAKAVSLLGIFATFAALVFGGEINDFTRAIIRVVLAISGMLFATSILSGLFGVK